MGGEGYATGNVAISINFRLHVVPRMPNHNDQMVQFVRYNLFFTITSEKREILIFKNNFVYFRLHLALATYMLGN